MYKKLHIHENNRFCHLTDQMNPFVPNGPFLYPLKPSENILKSL